jgi:hypothetical protein
VDRFLLRVFQSEVALQCKFVLRAAEQLEQWAHEVEVQDADMRRDWEAEQKVRTEQLEATARGDMEASFADMKRRTEMLSQRKPIPDQTTGAWYALQGILVSAANISKLLWGSSSNPEKRKQIEAERQDLRRSLAVTKKSPLHSRYMRNDFEHIDARIAAMKPGDNYIGRNIGPAVMISGGGRRFGHYDPEADLVTFWRRAVNIRKIIDEAARIQPLAEAAFLKPS